ncbi:MAG TPA: glycoside hydrolase family 30 beta sandwich domain-containing protein, partial [Verrucomicrobiae bacterium]|nr:glycoside hydrolase family 30 beta sandwich domain-containing protein [Verrucomicrobiae bacterium]
SKFIRPGARRIISSSTDDDLLTTAFLNPDGTIAVIVMNPSETAQPFYLCMGSQSARTDSPARSIITLVISNRQGKDSSAVQRHGLPADVN